MKFGRLPRKRNPRVPHLSALLAGVSLPPPPQNCNYLNGMGQNFGAMLNDEIGDCTCAAYYHARQVWTYNATSVEDTEPDSDVEKLYEAFGYVPGNPDTDQGAAEQDVLTYLLNTGAPTTSGLEKLLAFVEVDPRNTDDIKRVIAEFGGCYIGFNVPASLMENGPPAIWSDTNRNQSIVGGHAVFVAGYDADYLYVISWGQTYKMTWGFFLAWTDEAYALLDQTWIKATGVSPLGMTVPQLEGQMSALKEAA